VTLDTCYSACVPVWYAAILSCIPASHPYRRTSIKCHMNTVVSPDDGPTVAWNMLRLINILRINILRKTVQQVGFIYKIIQWCTVNKTQNCAGICW